MEVLNPSPPPSPPLRLFSHAGVSATNRRAADGGKVYVAVGRSPEKTLGLLRWTFRRFGCREIGLLHVHHPSPLIPTLLGKIPAYQANEELVSSHRKMERETMTKILLRYMSYCHKAQVQASVIVTENEQIQSGIVDMVTLHGIRKLIMGSAPDNCFRLKGGSSKAIFTARNAPPFCKIWFICKGRHIWTREATDLTESFVSVCGSYDTVLREKVEVCSENNCYEVLPSSECIALINPELQGSRMDQNELTSSELVNLTADSVVMFDVSHCDSQESRSLSRSATCIASTFNHGSSSETISKGELETAVLHDQLKELMEEVETSKKLAFIELAKRKQLESEVAEALNRVKIYEAAYQHEARIREELEDLLKITKQQHEELMFKKDEIMKELQHTMDTVAILDSRAQDLALCRDEAAGELELIKASIEILTREKQKTHQGRERYIDQIGRLRSSSTSSLSPSPNCNWLDGSGDYLNNFIEFTLSDLKTATCNFSESFMLRQGGYGCVYKGEIRNKTVMIKKLHPHDSRSLIEFEQEVYVLSKLRHPHLVTLIGVCPEALALVYEYMPCGTLQDHLVSKTNRPMTWKIRARIIAEISSALLFLHSSKPEKIVHCALTPENIFLDDSFNCKIGNLGTCWLLRKDAGHNLLFRQSIDIKGALLYADPEYMTKESRPKSDVYSFGVIVLQLLSGKSPIGLVSKVRRAMLSGNLSSVLDPTAGEWPSDAARSLAEFGLQCCESTSPSPPEITPEVVRELQRLHLTEERPVPAYFLCPVLQEIMHDPQVAADGFTYEGRTLREWFSSGRETSPMTNLKLKHLNLTCNHALRFAIQDWLCQS
ncbi:U-box domain-containing protein 33 [Canna indica]|uniref:RING-type E3 ubiquitin transferase n=1 Tax=Canna indica TaxID=4628 RepID=A0AAQ3L0S9_9LILI|nr:U-box domain-containing protein 33 [Canna indica]